MYKISSRQRPRGCCAMHIAYGAPRIAVVIAARTATAVENPGTRPVSDGDSLSGGGGLDRGPFGTCVVDIFWGDRIVPVGAKEGLVLGILSNSFDALRYTLPIPVLKTCSNGSQSEITPNSNRVVLRWCRRRKQRGTS